MYHYHEHNSKKELEKKRKLKRLSTRNIHLAAATSTSSDLEDAKHDPPKQANSIPSSPSSPSLTDGPCIETLATTFYVRKSRIAKRVAEEGSKEKIVQNFNRHHNVTVNVKSTLLNHLNLSSINTKKYQLKLGIQSYTIILTVSIRTR